MRKQFIILVIIALLVCVGLSGCSSVIGNQLEGTWKGSKTVSEGLSTITFTELTFTGNNLVYVTWSMPYLYNGTTSSGTYQTQGNKLLMSFQSGESYSFTYSISGDKLYLDGSEFTKQ